MYRRFETLFRLAGVFSPLEVGGDSLYFEDIESCSGLSFLRGPANDVERWGKDRISPFKSLAVVSLSNLMCLVVM